MRIISGKLKGKRINAPSNLPARPTTDFAKTGLFNILNNYFDYEGLHVLDLFGGTGSITLEFASRGAEKVVYVDRDFRSSKWLKEECAKLQLKEVTVIKSNVFPFLDSCSETFDVIFADPPYETGESEQIPAKIFDKKLLKENGLLIVEHGERQHLNHLPGFKEERKYGNVQFSFFTAG